MTVSWPARLTVGDEVGLRGSCYTITALAGGTVALTGVTGDVLAVPVAELLPDASFSRGVAPNTLSNTVDRCSRLATTVRDLCGCQWRAARDLSRTPVNEPTFETASRHTAMKTRKRGCHRQQAVSQAVPSFRRRQIAESERLATVPATRLIAHRSSDTERQRPVPRSTRSFGAGHALTQPLARLSSRQASGGPHPQPSRRDRGATRTGLAGYDRRC